MESINRAFYTKNLKYFTKVSVIKVIEKKDCDKGYI